VAITETVKKNTGFCTNVNPGFAGGAYGYVGMGLYMEGQAEYLRVPYADFDVVKLSNTNNLYEKDFILLTDIFPTGWGGVAQSGFKPGETIAIFGPGPVGLMTAYSAKLQGASKYYY
jgi:glutathione-independent formaldehyde dehydrogenase